jgi:HAE1 family hydrophobic/amphiphilic exporter-1
MDSFIASPRRVVVSIILYCWSASLLRLPVAQRDHVRGNQILATYVGADAQTLEQAVATPLGQQMNGVDSMIHMSP